MRATERYLKHATRGLWGKARQNVRLELRGAIEDKIHRHRLLGLTEEEATRAALRDLGDPHTVARELNRVHTLPHAARAALLAGVATLLGVQALAGVPVVRAISGSSGEECRKFVASPPEQRSAWERERYEQLLREKNGVAGLLHWCRAYAESRSDLLLLSDLVAAFEAAGIRLTPVIGADNLYQLSFSGGPGIYTLYLRDQNKVIDGEKTIQTNALLQNLLTSLPQHIPLRLVGLDNPTLQVGPAQLKIGTESNPVRATDLYALPIINDLEAKLGSLSKHRATLGIAFEDSLVYSPADKALRVGGPDGSLYAVVTNEPVFTPLGAPVNYVLRVRATRDGLIPLEQSAFCNAQRPCNSRVVSTAQELLNATERREAAALVYSVDSADLHDLNLTPLPASRVRLIPYP
ncbi:hypothetical protein DAETH_31740 [Deinococcus aetherius]|uniref:Uncharacterized protein n=1 Tax=Deinococcus aetherius TaxID=200252 RepID=A0ABN6RIM2_9DEIO|nr:permease prefix domain 1-containing protein [Deinococcus aetherius]BDP43205.1 hypothetical protein DAETH_31740 [Deinococcus aetherius]